ncbi:Arc family DNA-binding protein [Aminobacter sp. MSH1]|uniref:Arc family DNA-binding protein n=1 Tax=Aminobacter sp. MSH1 TaxID=374606 RepID=UPI00131F2339|nr:Arc family DNA-binding protein [Aminobacter sp. MSH1]
MAENRSKPDQYLLRLPAGLKDRIKAYAEYQGRSMNEEIIRILEREFPEPWQAGDRFDEIFSMLSVLQRGKSGREDVAKLVAELKETIVGIYSGRVQGLDDDTRRRISKQYEEWQEREFEYEQDIASEEYDAVEDESLRRTGRSEKFVYPNGTVGPQHEWQPVERGEGTPSVDDPFEDPFEDDKK